MLSVRATRNVYRTSYRYKPGINKFGKRYSRMTQSGQMINVVAGLSTSSWQKEHYFSEPNWESNYTEILKRQQEKAGNSGQESILSGDFFDGGSEYCRESGEDYNAEDFVNFLEDYLGESKFNAISEIIADCAVEMYEGLDYSIGGDGVGAKAFGLLTRARIFRNAL